MSRARSRGFQLRLLGAAFGAFSLFPIGVALYSAACGLMAAGWPSVDGRILESGWTVQDGRNTVRIPKVRYRYAVDGRSY